MSSATISSSSEYSASSSRLSIRVLRSPRLPSAASSGLELALDDRPAALRFRLVEQAADLARALALLLQLLLDHQDFQPRQPVELELQDGVGLLGVQPEALHDLLGCVGLALRVTDQLQYLVERVEDLLEALEDVDALGQRGVLVGQPPRHHFQPEMQEVPEDLRQIEALGPADLRVLGRHQAGQVEREVRSAAACA